MLAGMSSRTPLRVPPTGTLLPDSSSTMPPSSLKPPCLKSSICSCIAVPPLLNFKPSLRCSATLKASGKLS